MYIYILQRLAHIGMGLLVYIWQTLSSAASEDLRGIRSKLATEPLVLEFPLSLTLSHILFSLILDGISFPKSSPRRPHLSSSPPFRVYLYCTDGILKQD